MNNAVRRRLSPQARRNQLLDCARELILKQGLSSLTMEVLAQQAGVSNPLIYKYFDTRLQVLQELLIREYATFKASLKDDFVPSDNYRDTVRTYVEINFRQFAGGDILSILFNQPDVRQALTDKERPRHAPLLIRELANQYSISKRQAEQIIVLASGASLAAAEYFGQYGGNQEVQIEQAVDFILAGINQLTQAR